MPFLSPLSLFHKVKNRTGLGQLQLLRHFLIHRISDDEDRQRDHERRDDDGDRIVVTAAVIGTVCGCVSLALTAGGIIGSAIWYWKNRKKKKGGEN